MNLSSLYLPFAVVIATLNTFLQRPLLLMNIKPVQEKIDKLKEIQESVEKLLVGNQFMAGDQLTLADYAFVTITDILEVSF